MSMKKAIAVLLALMMILAAFAGCASQSGGNQSQANPDGEKPVSSSNQQDNEDKSNEEVYTAYVMAIGDAKTEDCREVADYISSLTEDKIGVKVELTRGVTQEQLNLALTSGEKLDLFAAVPWYIPLSSMASTGQVVALDDLLQNQGKETYEAISKDDWNCVTIGGSIYGVPMNKDKAQNKNFQMRKSYVEELGIDYEAIKTLDDLEAVLKEVKEKLPEVYPVGSASGSIGLPLPYDDLADSFGVIENVFEDDTTVVNLFETESYKEMVARMYRWNQEGLIMPDATSNTSSLEQLLGAGTIFGGFVPSKPGAVLQASREAGTDLVQCQIVEPFSITAMVAAPWCIASNSENPEKAMALLNMMYTDADVSNAFIYGIEGKHYKYVDKETNAVDYVDGITTANTGYSVLGWSWPNQQVGAIWNGDDADIWQQLNDFNTNARKSPAKGFTWNNANVLNEVTACQNVLSKYKNGLECGVLEPEETLAAMNKELKDAGLDTIIQEKQSQLDAWLANQ